MSKRSSSKFSRIHVELGLVLLSWVTMLTLNNLHPRITLSILLISIGAYIAANKAHYVARKRQLSAVYVSELVLVGLLTVVASSSLL